MSKRIYWILTVLAMLALCSCSVAPEGKTIIINRPAPTPTAVPSTTVQPFFEIDKATVIPISGLDQAGYFGSGEGLVRGWLDSDHLAAIGVRPVTAGNQTPRATALDIKIRELWYMSAQGLVGQILSVDAMTGQWTELHTVQDEVITSLGLSHDKSKLWYCSSTGKGVTKLSVSDISFTHELLKVDTITGFAPLWSQKDGLLAFWYENNWDMISLFDGVDVVTYPAFEASGTQLIGLWEDTGQGLYIFRDGMMLMMPLYETDSKEKPMEIVVPQMRDEGAAEELIKTQVMENVLFYECRGGSGYRLYAVDIDSRELIFSRSGVTNFTLSDDGKYICTVRESSDGSDDVYVGRWDGSRIADDKLVFKGFAADIGLYFSPDNAKLYMEGRYSHIDSRTVGMVLVFR